jgi:hypothetical protein
VLHRLNLTRFRRDDEGSGTRFLQRFARFHQFSFFE